MSLPEASRYWVLEPELLPVRVSALPAMRLLVDNDGVANGIEYIIGATTATNDLAKLPAATTEGGNMIFTFIRHQSSIDGSTSLIIEVWENLIDWSGIHLVPATADATLKWDQTINLNGAARTVQVNNGSAAIDAKISRNINGNATLAANIFNKTGLGTLALTANCFYNLGTNVNAGTLMIGDGGGTGGTSNTTPNIIVASGATLAANRNNTPFQDLDLAADALVL